MVPSKMTTTARMRISIIFVLDEIAASIENR